jgi:hypothetical protein
MVTPYLEDPHCGDACECDLCPEYSEKYDLCITLQNNDRNLDIEDCYFGGYDIQGACEDAKCTWYANKNRCVSDICIGDTTFDGKIKGKDKNIPAKDYGRINCPIGGDDLCQKYLYLYNFCVDQCSVGRNLNIEDCYFGGYDTEGACEDAGCTWYIEGNRCVPDICIGDTTFDGKVKGVDKNIPAKDYGRQDCPGQ